MQWQKISLTARSLQEVRLGAWSILSFALVLFIIHCLSFYISISLVFVGWKHRRQIFCFSYQARGENFGLKKLGLIGLQNLTKYVGKIAAHTVLELALLIHVAFCTYAIVLLIM